MDRRKIFVYGITAVAISLAIAGCHTPTITADYTMPPRAVSDIKNIDTMEIVVNVNMADSKDAAVAKGIICKKIAAGFANEGFYRTTDLIWGNSAGASNMHAILRSKDSRHGYARIATDPIRRRARMIVTFNADISTYETPLVVRTKLKKVYYKTMYRTQEISWGSGERINRERIRIPYSVPSSVARSIAQTNVKQYKISATGSMDVKVIDKKGKTVYHKSFNHLNALAECDHDSLKALPGKASLISSMSHFSIANIVKDLSPYKVSRSVKINKDGDERGFLLLNAMAFSEAFDVFENIKENERTFADWENLGIICEVLGDYENAKRCFETAVKVKKKDKGLFDYDKNIAENGINRIKKVIEDQERFEKIK